MVGKDGALESLSSEFVHVGQQRLEMRMREIKVRNGESIALASDGGDCG